MPGGFNIGFVSDFCLAYDLPRNGKCVFRWGRGWGGKKREDAWPLYWEENIDRWTDRDILFRSIEIDIIISSSPLCEAFQLFPTRL